MEKDLVSGFAFRHRIRIFIYVAENKDISTSEFSVWFVNFKNRYTFRLKYVNKVVYLGEPFLIVYIFTVKVNQNIDIRAGSSFLPI